MTAIIVRLPNWIGDTLMALPTIEQLVSSGATVHTLGRPWAVELLRGYAQSSGSDRRLSFSVGALPRGLRTGAKVLRAAAHDLDPENRAATKKPHLLLMTHSLSSAVMARWAGLSPIGFRRDLRGFLLAHAAAWPDAHEARRYWQLGALTAQTAGLAWPEGDPPAVRLRLDDAHRAAAHAARTTAGITGDYIAICPLATGLVTGRPKQWPGFPQLTARLVSAGNTVVAVAPPDRLDDLRAAVPGAVVIAGVPAGAFAAILADARQVFANDSGPMHLAAAVGVPTVGIFGVSNPARTGAWGGRFTPVGGPDGWPEVDGVMASAS